MRLASHPSHSLVARSAVCIVCLWTLGLTSWAEQTQLPPKPSPPNLRGLTPTQEREAQEQYWAAQERWRKSLTPAQSAECERQWEERQKELGKRRMDEAPMPDLAHGYSWQTAAKDSGLNPAEIVKLGHDKVLIEDRQYKQSFEIYIEPTQPLFVTSDSLLNGFHVLFEDSFRELELRRAPELRRRLEEVLTQARENLKKSPFLMADMAPGWRKAQIVVGPALCLMGTPVDFFDAEVRDEIQKQVAKIKAASAVELPLWLGPPAPELLSLDYRRCKPVGFYAESRFLSDYFRAVRWLQMIPFRADRDDELAAIGMLGYGMMNGRFSNLSFFRSYNAILGPPNASSLGDAAYEFQSFFHHRDSAQWKDLLQSKRRWLLRTVMSNEEFKRLVDDNRLPPQAGRLLPEIQFRVLPGLRLPDSVLFQQLANAQLQPEGLAFAAMLGSSFARSGLTRFTPEQFDVALTASRPAESARDEPVAKSVYDDYLDVLRALFLPPSDDTPDFLHGKAWQAKSCQTALSSWVQMRHTFTLQASISRSYAGLTEKPPGFVEPMPEFYGRMASLVERIQAILTKAEVFLPSPRAIEERLKSDAEFLESLQFHLASANCDIVQKLPEAQRERYDGIVEGGSTPLPGWNRKIPDETTSPGEFQAFHRDLIAAMRDEAARYERGERQPAVRESLLRMRWEILDRLCRRLESLAHKQLRREPWTQEEEHFLRNYGEDLGAVMGYLGNSWLVPGDDAPRWVEVHGDPNTDRSLAVGVGRARRIHVLYPWQGYEILCQGAVMPYYEYQSKDRLTDAEWMTLLDSPQAPPLPDWIQPFVAR